MEAVIGATIVTSTITVLSTLSPINKLNLDVLSRIFWENTDMFEKDPVPNFEIDENNNKGDEHLDILRRTAQVCRLWREIIMGSSALWGRVIDLNLLQWKRHACWRREVIARAGQAPLHVVGTIRMGPEDFRVFFGKLLDERWSSIQRFAVFVLGELDPAQINPDIWHPLQRPSPLLQTFKLFFQDRNFPIFKTSDLPLFANSAPALCAFSFRGMPKAQFSLQAPWFQQLRSFELSIHTPCFRATDFMTVLCDMPYLESLSIKNSLFEPISNEYSQNVSLKFLTKLQIVDTFGTSLLLIKYIIPSSRCILNLEVGSFHQHSDVVSDNEIQDMCLALSRYTNLKGYLVEEQILADSLSLVLSPGVFVFTAPNLPHVPATEKQFWICFAFPDRLPPSLFSNLLSTLLNPHPFSRVKTFQFMSPKVVLLDTHQQEVLATFLSSLVSVTELQISVYNIHTLLQAQIRYPDIFPSLQILHLQVKRQFGYPSFPQNTLRFLEAKILRGRPVATLVLPDVAEPTKIAALKHLDVIQGLRVIWGGDEYICGSGSKEALSDD